MPKLFLSLCFVAVFGLVQPAQAAEWVENEHFRSRIAAVPEGRNTTAVLEVELEEGWHTYGQEPGDAGLPPRFNWEASKNLQEIEINWPEPIRKREMDMFDVNAYEGLVQFPLNIKPENEQDDVTLNLDLQIMICNEICIPDQVNLSTTLMAAHIP